MADAIRPASVEARAWGWRHAGRRRPAVAEVTFRIEPGERVLLLGASGAGKSTLLHGIAGVLGGDEEGERHGELLVDGLPPEDLRGRSGLVLQDPGSQLVMSRLGDDVAFGCENLGVPADEIWARVRHALGDVGLDLPLDHPTSALSGGQQQRVALAGVLAMRPGLLLLDEPTANLDPEGTIEVREAVAASLARTRATLIVIEHRVATWLPVVDRVIVLDAAGGVLADGRPEVVLDARADVLRTAGVWLPDDEPPRRRTPAPPVSDPLLQARELSVARVPGTIVRSGIETEVASGRVLALTGPNGTGKSTLALTLAGLLPPAGGVLRATDELTGSLRSRHPIEWRPRELLSRIGTVFQSPAHQFLRGTVRAELEVGPRALRASASERAAIVARLLETLGLARLADANPFTLSGGEQRRLSVATAIATAPRLLVLDEPTFGQDAVTWGALVELLAELRDGGTGIVAVTHDRPFVGALADAELRLDVREGAIA